MVAAPSGRDIRQAAQSVVCRQSFGLFFKLCRFPDRFRGTIRFESWPHQVELAGILERGDSVVVLKARQLGVSWCVAAYVLWLAMTRPNSLVLTLSLGQREAEEFLLKVHSLYACLPWHLRFSTVTQFTKRGADARIEFANGSRISALPATEDSGRGTTASVVVVDEAAFHPFAQANYSAYEPTLEGGGQLIMVSTSAGPNGLFYDQAEAARKGESGRRFMFVPWWSRPSRALHDAAGPILDARGALQPDPEWLERTRARYKRIPADFKKEYPSSVGEAWTATTGLVYGMDDDGVLVFDAAANLMPDPCRWEDCKYHFAYVDWGGGNPTAMGFIGVTSSGRMHQFAERTWMSPVGTAAIHEELVARQPPLGYDAIECGADEPVSIATLAAYGWPAAAADTRRGEGLGAVAEMLKSRTLTHNPETCPDSVEEYYSYRWAVSRDQTTKERYATSTPFNHHADHKDGCRYVVMKWLVMQGGVQADDPGYEILG